MTRRRLFGALLIASVVVALVALPLLGVPTVDVIRGESILSQNEFSSSEAELTEMVTVSVSKLRLNWRVILPLALLAVAGFACVIFPGRGNRM